MNWIRVFSIPFLWLVWLTNFNRFLPPVKEYTASLNQTLNERSTGLKDGLIHWEHENQKYKEN